MPSVKKKQKETDELSPVAPAGSPNVSSVSLAVLVPAYNEERFIGSVVHQARWYADLVMVVDDGSSDATARIAEEAGALLVRHALNRGKSAAINTGFITLKKIIKRNKKIKAVVMLDGDGQHRCAEIPRLCAPVLAGEADIVVGSRFLGVKSRIPKWRIFGQHALTLATNLGSGSKLTDSQSGFRAFSLRALEQMQFGSEGFSIESEMQFLAQEDHLKIMEAPISVIYREPAKRNPVQQGLAVLGGLIKLVGQYRPLLFFGISGLFSMILGMALGIYVVERFQVTGQFASGLGMICVLLNVLGLIMVSTGLILHSVRGLLSDLLHRGR
jgi:glycosyltransferase involved in cell wall biosynthesis